MRFSELEAGLPIKEPTLAEERETLRAYARTLPSQGGVEIGPWLACFAAAIPAGAGIVEVGCWLGAGTAHLAFGAIVSGAEIHCYDRWQATSQEVEKAAKFGFKIHAREDTLPFVRASLRRFDVKIHFHKGDIRNAQYDGGPIGLYVDDASKAEPLWNHAMATFKPHFVPRETILVLMDYHFDEKAGPKYAAQKRYMAAHSGEFQLIQERMGGTTVATFRYLG